MENQDHRTIHPPGHESHGVHLCHKCGWPFPNPHPSAKQRRSHKKVCGKIQGYRLMESEGSTHLTISDDEHLSDDDHKSPSPRVLETSKNKMGSGISEGKSIRSEDEVFSDAVAEFSESGLSAGVSEHVRDIVDPVADVENNTQNESNRPQASEGSEITDPIALPTSLTDDKMQNPEVPETVRQIGSGLESSPNDQSVNVATDFRTEEESAVLLIDQKNDTSADLYPIEPEKVKQENADNNSSDNVKKEMEETRDEHIQDIEVSLGNTSGESSEPARKIEETVSSFAAADGVTPLKNDHSFQIQSESPQIDHCPEVEALKASPKVGDSLPEISTSGESSTVKDDQNENEYVLSVPADLNILDNPESLVEDFKDHKGVKPQESASLDGYEESCSPSKSRETNEGPDVSSLSEQVVETGPKQEGGISELIHGVPVQGVDLSQTMKFEEVIVPQINAAFNDNEKEEEKQSSADAIKPGVENSHNLCTSNERDEIDTSKELSLVNSFDVTKFSPDLHNMVAVLDNQMNLDQEKSVGFDLSGDNNSEGTAGKSTAEDAVCILESQVTNIYEGGDTGDQEIKKLDKYGTVDSENEEGPTEKNLPIQKIDGKETFLDENLPMKTECTTDVDNNSPGKFGGEVVSSESLQEEVGNNVAKPQLGASLIDVSVDSSSQTDSLEGNWGSVSVLSTQSDIPATASHASAEAEKNISKKASEGQQSDKSDIFEPPSFMTLVEPGGRSGQNTVASEIQTLTNTRQSNSESLQAAWFPSHTHVVNDSEGRKKNEEIIAKVTNWSTGKQHTPLKSLLGEAALESKQKSPKWKENLAPVIQKDEKEADNNAATATTINTIFEPESGKREVGKEWDSPARYPADIKREKKKEKGKPYWVQFVCCSSVH